MNTLTLLRQDSRRLEAFPLASAHTVADAEERVTAVLSPHRLAVGRGEHVDVSLHSASVGALPVLLLRYGADVFIQPEVPSRHVLLQLVISGHVDVESDAGHFGAEAGQGLLIDLEERNRLHWSADCQQVIIPIPHAALAAAAEAIAGDSAASLPRLRRVFGLDEVAASGTIDLIRYSLAQLAAPRQAPAFGDAVLDLFARQLLLHHSDIAAQPVATMAPACVRRAERFMREHLESDIDLQALSAAARTSSRSLCDNFRQFRGRSPIATLRDMRLRAARLLLVEDASTTVTDVALRFQFNHMGRFAAAYRRRFGETPSATLRRRQ